MNRDALKRRTYWRCSVCGRRDLEEWTKRHFWQGDMCKGQPVQTTYVELLAADYEALADAIRSPMGVVPDSAAGLVDATDLQREIIESAKAVLAVVDRKTDAVDRLKAAIAAAGG